MGQRHQIYLRDMNGAVVGVHHQWLYGMNAANQAIRMMTMANEMLKNPYSFKEAFQTDAEESLRALGAVYSCVPEKGYLTRVHVLEDGETRDPRLGDNNDGITVFDFLDAGGAAKKKPGYCMMSVGEGDSTIMTLPALEPVGAHKYARTYYPLAGPWTTRKEKKAIKEIENEISAIGDKAHSLRLLTRQECAEIFPAMYAEAK